MVSDRPLYGLLLMLGFCIVAPAADAVAKLLGQTMPIGQLVFFRFAIQAVLLIPLVWVTARPWRMRGRVLRLTLLRTVMHVFGIGLMVAALQYLPLADAIAICFVMPFLLLVLGRLLLKEEVGRRRILAALAGFSGTLLVIQPSFTEVGWAALLPLGVALNFAFFILVTRQIAKETDPVGLQAVSGVFAVGLIGPALLLGPVLPLESLALISPNGTEWMLLLGIGLLGTLAHLLMTWSLRFAPAATLAPLQYLEIPVAAMIGLAVFGDWPDALALMGILVTVAAGLYVAITEKSTAAPAGRRAPAPPSQTAQPAE
ncbi:DMT family transporter [Marimonas arenosa]|uniref:DMT family transporter n=1 Tax=Marimonas arenosa TaxID=1795305 RepID=A0AAE4B4H9_9RHOB|nr:DMT family transporter [Marimonas arenosa]MDQ2091068.1 DMT family transporter [Marimonas arenosa]